MRDFQIVKGHSFIFSNSESTMKLSNPPWFWLGVRLFNVLSVRENRKPKSLSDGVGRMRTSLRSDFSSSEENEDILQERTKNFSLRQNLDFSICKKCHHKTSYHHKLCIRKMHFSPIRLKSCKRIFWMTSKKHD